MVATTVGETLPRLHARRVDDHVGHVVALEEGERLAAVLVVEPARVPELDQHLVAAELLLRPLEVLERRGLEDDVRRQLHQDPAELARLAQRLQRLVEAAEDLGPELPRRPVDAAARVERRGFAQVGRQLLGLDRVPRHHAEGLHVHHEPLGRALGPVLDQVLVREPVVGRVRLDHVEALGVVAQPLFGALDSRRIEVLRQRLVGPGAGSDPDRRGHASMVRGGRFEIRARGRGT